MTMPVWAGHKGVDKGQLLKRLKRISSCGAGTGLWAGSGGANSTGDDWDPTVTKEEFYTSGQNAQFTVINGVYSPTITMKVTNQLTQSCSIILQA